jgi:hypothetical protein
VLSSSVLDQPANFAVQVGSGQQQSDAKFLE